MNCYNSIALVDSFLFLRADEASPFAALTFTAAGDLQEDRMATAEDVIID